MSPEVRKAMEACASLRPTGGPVGTSRERRADDGSALRAYRTCMKDNGVELPESGRLRDLKTDDPKTAEALEKCRPLRPTPAPGGGTAEPVPTPAA